MLASQFFGLNLKTAHLNTSHHMSNVMNNLMKDMDFPLTYVDVRKL